MLDLAILIVFAIGILVGLKRGFILQAIHLVSFIVAFIVAKVYYTELAPKLILWIPYPNFSNDQSNFLTLFGDTDLEDAYYRAIAFVAIFLAVKILLHIIGTMLDFVAHLPILNTVNRTAGAILGFIEVYLILFIILYIGALVPINLIQQPIAESGLAKFIIENTPIFSQQIKEMWIEYVAA